MMKRSLDVLSSFKEKARATGTKSEPDTPVELGRIGAGSYENPDASQDSFNDRVEQVLQVPHGQA